MKIQNMTWGYIEWHNINEEGNINHSMNLGTCVISPNQRQYPHVHHGEEQFHYILEGACTHIVNGIEHILNAGMQLYMEAGCTHECINTGTVPVRSILVSNPIQYTQSVFLSNEPLPPNFSSNLYAAVEAIRGNLQQAITVPYTIFDTTWSIILQNGDYSDSCTSQCSLDKTPCDSICLSDKALTENMQATLDYSQFTCKQGMTIYHLPIMLRKNQIGTLRGGHFLLSDTSNQDGVYGMTQNNAIGIRQVLQQITRSIEAYCEFDLTREGIQEKNTTIAEVKFHKKKLEKSLKLTQDTVTNLRINHHFLFNTLNCMADMALCQKGEDVYSAIIDLSRMFLYTMYTGLKFVTLQNELEYLGHYINLQKLRYGDRLQYSEKIERPLLDKTFPFNFLQPIIENAFVHGFHEYEGIMCVIVEAYQTEKTLVISVRNNGKHVDNVTLFRVKNALKSNSGHGLSLIYTKLLSTYGGVFEMDIQSDSDNMTCVSIRLSI